MTAEKYRYHVVEVPPPDVICPICHDILEEPHLTDCCGHHFCKQCISKLSNPECPMCRGENFNSIRNRNFERNSLNILMLQCPNTATGCTWSSKLGELKEHLELCLFEEISCPYKCGQKYPRRCVRVHQSDLCTKRRYSCRYCKYEATHEEITGHHHEVCERYPVDCPNYCSGGKVERAMLQSHLDTECPLQPMHCEYQPMGCSFRGTREELVRHMEDQALHHASSVARQTLTTTLKTEERLVARIESQFADMSQQLLSQQNEIVSLKTSMRALEAMTASLHAQLLQMQKTVTILKIDRLCLSDIAISNPFYTHPQGYKLRLRILTEGETLGIYCYIVHGEHDDQLKWPFRGLIQVEVMNQLVHNNHFTYMFDYANATDQQACRATRLMSESVSSLYPGLHKTSLAHSDINNTCYLKNNCLQLKVSVLSI